MIRTLITTKNDIIFMCDECGTLDATGYDYDFVVKKAYEHSIETCHNTTVTRIQKNIIKVNKTIDSEEDE